MKKTIRYKQFDVTVEVVLQNVDYRITCHMQQIDDPKQPPHSWLSFEQFSSEKEAYEYALEKAGAWIDAQPTGNS